MEVLPGSNLSSWWGRAGRLGGVTVPLDTGSIHHFLATTDNEDARRQVSTQNIPIAWLTDTGGACCPN